MSETMEKNSLTCDQIDFYIEASTGGDKEFILDTMRSFEDPNDALVIVCIGQIFYGRFIIFSSQTEGELYSHFYKKSVPEIIRHLLLEKKLTEAQNYFVKLWIKNTLISALEVPFIDEIKEGIKLSIMNFLK